MEVTDITTAERLAFTKGDLNLVTEQRLIVKQELHQPDMETS